jgi:MOSC domain-containing protein YiiM
VTAGARVSQINVSRGGVPKRPVPSARIARDGVEGDRQDDLRYHGGPERAVSVWSLEVIEALRAEGHPVAPGGAGENLTLTGLDWHAVRPGARLLIGAAGGGTDPVESAVGCAVELEVTSFAAPCNTIRANFIGGAYDRISDKSHPGSSRVYCRVLREGQVRPGDAVVLQAAPAPGC